MEFTIGEFKNVIICKGNYEIFFGLNHTSDFKKYDNKINDVNVFFKKNDNKISIIIEKNLTLRIACILFDVLADIELDNLIKIDIVVLILSFHSKINYIRPKKQIVVFQNKGKTVISLADYDKKGLIKQYKEINGLKINKAEIDIYWLHCVTEDPVLYKPIKRRTKTVNSIRPLEERRKINKKAQANTQFSMVTIKTGLNGTQLQKRSLSTRQQSQNRKLVSDYSLALLRRYNYMFYEYS